MNRRNFLSRAGLLVAGGVIAGPEVLEAFARLTWKRRLWPGAAIPGDIHDALRNYYADARTHLFPLITPLLAQFERKPRSLFAPPTLRMQWGGELWKPVAHPVRNGGS